MWFKRYPPYFDKSAIAMAIYDITRDEVLVSAMSIALYAKYGTRVDGRSTMGALANADHVRAVLNERASQLGIPDLDVMVRIFERQILTCRRR